MPARVFGRFNGSSIIFAKKLHCRGLPVIPPINLFRTFLDIIVLEGYQFARSHRPFSPVLRVSALLFMRLSTSGNWNWGS
jgi:hypothetical protein